MGVLGAGYSFGATEQCTAAKFATLVNSGTVGSIVNADIDAAAAIANSKLNLASIAQAVALTGGLTLSSNPLVMTTQPVNMAKGADIASATPDIGAATGNYIDVTGTTTITALGTVQAGTQRVVRFTGILTLTHNGTSLLLPTAANITTAVNDVAGFVSLGSGNWKCLWYQRYDGTSLVASTAATALSGSVIQVVNTETGAVASGTTLIPLDDTIPQNTEGDQYMTLAITPNATTNKLKIHVVCVLGASNGSGSFAVCLFQDSTAGALAVVSAVDPSVNNYNNTVAFTHYMTAGTTSSTTFKVRAGLFFAGTLTFNGVASARKFGGVMASSITIEEIKA
jgi:hypothetical protein